MIRLRTLLVGLCVCVLAAHSQTAPKKAPPRRSQPAKTQGTAALPLVKKSALDKATLEVYLRHLMPWIPPVQVAIGDPRPSDRLPGFLEVDVRASLGQASQEETFLISKDGQKILTARIYDVNQNPFKSDLAKLNTQGFIRAYAALLDPHALGLDVCAYVQVLLDRPGSNPGFVEQVRLLPQVLECHHITGEFSYLLKIRVRSIPDFEALLDERIKSMPGVVRSETAIVLSTAKETPCLAIGEERNPA